MAFTCQAPPIKNSWDRLCCRTQSELSKGHKNGVTSFMDNPIINEPPIDNDNDNEIDHFEKKM